MELVGHQITIVKAMKGVVKVANIVDIITADTDKFQNKNHSHHHDGNGKKLGDGTRKFNYYAVSPPLNSVLGISGGI